MATSLLSFQQIFLTESHTNTQRVQKYVISGIQYSCGIENVNIHSGRGSRRETSN